MISAEIISQYFGMTKRGCRMHAQTLQKCNSNSAPPLAIQKYPINIAAITQSTEHAKVAAHPHAYG